MQTTTDNSCTSIRDVQEKLLVLLDEFDRICSKYEIDYTLAFGTALGARREQGFIPWDDDIDVQMDETNYKKLLDVLNQDLDSKFEYECFETDKRYNIMLPDLKIRMKGTHIEELPFSLKSGTDMSGLFLDVFVLHNIAPNKFVHEFHRYVSKLLLIPVYLFTQTSINPKWLKTLIYNYSKWYSNKYRNSGDVYLSLCWSHEDIIGDRMHIDDIFPGKRGLFEGRMVPLPRNIDAYLTERYGKNFMIPPQGFLQRPTHLKNVEAQNQEH